MGELEGALVGQWAEQRRDWEPTKEQRGKARKKKRRSRRGKNKEKAIEGGGRRIQGRGSPLCRTLMVAL